MIASNPNVDIKTLERLSKDNSRFVLEKIACNQKTPSHVVKKLVEDKKFGVAYMRDELALGSIDKWLEIGQNHPMIQQRQKFFSWRLNSYLE